MSSIEPEPQDDLAELPPPRPTTPPLRRGFVWVLLLLCLLTAVVYGVPYMLDQIGYAYEKGRARASAEALAKLDQAGALARASELFRLATHAVSPAVVHIRTQSFGKDGGTNLGSGVVIDRDKGLIVTNQHVIRDADLITVRVGRTEMIGELVGAGPQDRPGRGPGQGVAADGRRVGRLGQARGRRLGPGHRQPVRPGADRQRRDRLGDLAEQPGDGRRRRLRGLHPDRRGDQPRELGRPAGRPPGPGGRDQHGDLAGRPADRGNQGIGFAISSAMARRVVEQLVKSGKVVRAYLGVVPQPITPDRARQLKVPEGKGAAIGLVLPGEPGREGRA